MDGEAVDEVVQGVLGDITIWMFVWRGTCLHPLQTPFRQPASVRSIVPGRQKCEWEGHVNNFSHLTYTFVSACQPGVGHAAT